MDPIVALRPRAQIDVRQKRRKKPDYSLTARQAAAAWAG
jgi:hypothetical protein